MAVRQGEYRRSRDSFTRTLCRIAARIATLPVYELTWKEDILHRQHQCHIDIGGFWVAGSYARGALDCGDLDIIINLGKEASTLAWTSKISRTVIGHAPDVRLYVGTPEENSSGIAFPEAKLIWSPTLPDWQAAISGIPADPTATRYARRNDELPLRPEQFHLGRDTTIDQLLDLREGGLIEWAWIPADEINVQPEKWSDDALKFTRILQIRCGKKTQEVMQLVIQYYEQQQRGAVWQRDRQDKVRFRFGGAQVFVGRPPVEVELLGDLSCSSLVIAPHLSRRGPNGLWILSRGVNHPLERAFNETQAYYLSYQQSPLITVNADSSHFTAYSVDLFQSRKEAKKRIDEEKTQFDIDLDVAIAQGGDLLKLIADVDIIDIGSESLPISETGERFLDESQAVTVEEILMLIKNH